MNTLDKARLEITSKLDPDRRSELGQFMTPATVARFMASLFPPLQDGKTCLLDPGAGMGSLTVAFMERWIKEAQATARLQSHSFEIDDVLRGHLVRNLAPFEGMSGISLTAHGRDFVEAATRSISGDFFEDRLPSFTHAILNPPYKKINSTSRFRGLLRQSGIETVNLYSAFVALAIQLLGTGGQLVAIVPRSFCNGPYYRPFRDLILQGTSIKRLHLFDARDKAFREDNVLQENVIVHLERGGMQGAVCVSTSTDETFDDCLTIEYDFTEIVHPGDAEAFIHIPTGAASSALTRYRRFDHSLSDLDLQVSTGPVVDFRLRPHLKDMPEPGTVPLLYPCHLVSGRVKWPIENGRKPNAMLENADTMKWLLPNGFYTVVRRFSSKEERRRIVAGVVDPACFDTAMLGFENHLNVFHAAKRGIPRDLAWGLSTFLNSSCVDSAFRRFNGHTQVNATDLRTMKYPSRSALMELGRWAEKQPEISQDAIDTMVMGIT